MEAANYPLTLDEIALWFRSKQTSLAGSGIVLAEIHERSEYTPAARADFDGTDTMGRICGWVSGLFDFEVLRVSDGKFVFFRHKKVSTVDALDDAFSEFIRKMSEPSSDE